MKNILLLLSITLLLISCESHKIVKIISTGEKAEIVDYQDVYKVSDTIVLYKDMYSSYWRLDTNWYTKKDTSIGTTTFRIAIITKY